MTEAPDSAIVTLRFETTFRSTRSTLTSENCSSLPAPAREYSSRSWINAFIRRTPSTIKLINASASSSILAGVSALQKRRVAGDHPQRFLQIVGRNIRELLQIFV